MLNHKSTALNCLTEEQFKLLCSQYNEQDEMPCDCEDCGVYFLGDNRCLCGNRRIAVYYNDKMLNPEENYFYAEAY